MQPSRVGSKAVVTEQCVDQSYFEAGDSICFSEARPCSNTRRNSPELALLQRGKSEIRVCTHFAHTEACEIDKKIFAVPVCLRCSHFYDYFQSLTARGNWCTQSPEIVCEMHVLGRVLDRCAPHFCQEAPSVWGQVLDKR